MAGCNVRGHTIMPAAATVKASNDSSSTSIGSTGALTGGPFPHPGAWEGSSEPSCQCPRAPATGMLPTHRWMGWPPLVVASPPFVRILPAVVTPYLFPNREQRRLRKYLMKARTRKLSCLVRRTLRGRSQVVRRTREDPTQRMNSIRARKGGSSG